MDAYLSQLEAQPDDSSMQIINKIFFSPSFLTGFLKKYRSLACLWNSKIPEYSNNTIRAEGWEVLTAYCRNIFPSADVLWVKKKIQNMRGSVRKEVKKIDLTKQRGGSKEYKPKLWYFDLLSFIKDVENESTTEDGNISDQEADDDENHKIQNNYPDTSFETLNSSRSQNTERRDSESSSDVDFSGGNMFFTMFSQRGHKLIVLDGYKFRKDRETHCGKKWRCTVSTCNAQVLTSTENEEEVIQRMGDHNHSVSKKLPREFISNNLKQKRGSKEDIPLEILSAPPDLRCQITTADISRAKRNLTPRNRKKYTAIPHESFICETILTVSTDTTK